MNHEKHGPVCVQDIETLAKGNLKKLYFTYFASGSGEEDTLKENCQAFQRIKIRPRVLRGISEAELSTTVLGQRISMPICISPTAFHKMAHPDGEIATVRAADACQTCMTLSYWANTSIQDVADAAPTCLKWCAVKLTENENFVKDLVHQAENANYKAIVLTCDSPTASKRFTLERSKFILPPDIPIKNMEQFLGSAQGGSSFADAVKKFFGNRPITWEDVRWLKSYTKLPVVLKGILTPEDAKLAVEYGADAILVSNHGGRQLDGVPSTIEVLPEIVDAVQGKLEVYLDGGVRLGTDVFKALALGARAVFVGRPVIWGLAYKGENGVKKALNLLKEELRTAMILSGCGKLADITRRHVITCYPSKFFFTKNRYPHCRSPHCAPSRRP